ncbi:ribosome maturation factor RimM [Thalassobacillus hwangdonensis]|uniref:Ribosome maturation factor RimM n=1 Tax=Thalassobacillus hwangdonensis TaxID=546108 RepID=A0ABW3L0P9_9BACI
MNQTMFNVGKIVNTHGIRGEVKVLRITDFEERFEPGQCLYLSKEGIAEKELIIETHRQHKGFDLIKFEGHPNINDVEGYKNGMLRIKEDQLTDLEEDEFYYHEIIGCEVKLQDGTVIGDVKEILSPGANDVWVVKRKGEKDALIPYIEDVIKEVDIESGTIIIEPLEGLLD